MPREAALDSNDLAEIAIDDPSPAAAFYLKRLQSPLTGPSTELRQRLLAPRAAVGSG